MAFPCICIGSLHMEDIYTPWHMQASSNTYKRISAEHVSCCEIKWTYNHWSSDMQSCEPSNIELHHEHWSYPGTGHRHHNSCTHLHYSAEGRRTCESTHIEWICRCIRWNWVFRRRIPYNTILKGALCRIWCGVNRLGDSAVEVV